MPKKKKATTPQGPTIEDRIHDARIRLSALAYLLRELDPELEMDDDVTAGLALMLEDVMTVIAPIRQAPFEITERRAPEGGE